MGKNEPMRYNRKFLLGLLALVFLLGCTQTPEQRVKDGTVLIIAADADGSIGNGSGFFVQPNKIATNIHVIAGKRMLFAVGTKKVYNIEKVTGYNPERDLVVLQVSGEGKPLELSEAEKDDPIFVVGYPGGGYKVTEGTVHWIRPSDKQLRLVARGFPENRNSVLAHGNSGGPILNSEGKVIGIAVGAGKEGFNFINFSYAVAASTLYTSLKSAEEENLADWQKRKPICAYTYYAWGYEKAHIEKNYNEAIKGFDKAIAEYQEYAKAYVERGNAKTNLGESKDRGNLESARKLYQAAIKDYEKAIKLISDNATAYYNSGWTKLIRGSDGDYKASIEDYNKALEFNPDFASAYLDRGAAKGHLFNYAGAIEDYNEGIKREPKDPWNYYNNRGFAKLKSKDYAGAIKDYDKAIRLKDDFVRAYLIRGLAKADKSDPDYAGAIKDYNKVIDELNPKVTEMAEAYARRGNAKKALGQNEDAKQDHSIAYYYWGKADSNSGNYQAAINNFSKAIALVPNYAEVYHYRGDAYRLRGKKGDSQKATADYDKVVVLKPDYTEIHVVYNNRGLAKAAVNNYDGAIKDYTKAIGLKSNYAEAYYNRGEAYRLRGQKDNYQKAVDDYTRAIKSKEDFADAYHKRGLVKEALGHEDAKQDFALFYWHRVGKALEGNQYPEAVKNYDSILELFPDRAGFYTLRGRVKKVLGESKADLGDLEGARQLYQAAIDDHDEAIKLDKKNAEFYRNRGETKFLRAAVRDHNGMIEDYESAIEDFEAALKRKPKPNLTANIYKLRGQARCLFGSVKANQGNPKEARKQYRLALEDFEEAIKLDSDNAEYYKSLGLANAALGKAKEALSAFEKAKSMINK